MLYSAQNIILFFLTFIAIAAIVAYLWEYNRKNKNPSLDAKLIDQTQQKAFQIIHQAIRKAQSILGVAELEGLKIIAASKVSSGRLDKDYQDKLLQSIKTSEDLLSKEVTSAQKVLSEAEKEYLKFLDSLKVHTVQLEQQTQQLAINRMSQLFENFERRITDFLVKAQSSTSHSIELELRSARQLIETYKNQQLALIDENIVAMMEQTLAAVLGKKLSLKDQLDLVYEALEKAKIDKFII